MSRIELENLIERAVRMGASYGDKRGKPGPHQETFEDGLVRVIKHAKTLIPDIPEVGMKLTHQVLCTPAPRSNPRSPHL